MPFALFDAAGAPTLTAALLALALLVLLALFVPWAIARRRAERARALAWREAQRVAAARVEPALGEAPGGAAGDAGTPVDALAIAPRREARREGPRIDPLIDAVVTLALDAPVSGEALLVHWPGPRRVGTKLALVEGLDTETAEWAPPAPGRRYGELQAAIQLASRTGPLNEIEFSEFMQKVQALADAMQAVAEVPDMLEVVARARELDALASPLDAQITLTLKANSVAWSVGYLQQCAQRLGFTAGAMPGRLVLPGAEAGAPPLLVLGFDAQAAIAAAAAEAPPGAGLRECQLTLDVPQSPEAAEPFPAWHHAATRLADELDATACDDAGRALSLHAFSAIHQELGQLYRQLEALDLAAGSPAARRVFS
jgi:hypothetical protein